LPTEKQRSVSVSYEASVLRRFHGQWFRLSDEQFDFLHYFGISIYKIGILLFNLVHWLFYGSSAEDGRP